ncbi:MAG: GNAT family N-acetyltransferase [Rubrivivax sp.]|nr:GNAT family N-acetyltransferase [Rubrivivax sp.]
MSTPVANVEEVRDLAAVAADVERLMLAGEASDFQSGLDWYRLLSNSALPEPAAASLWVVRKEGVPVVGLPVRRSADKFGCEVLSLGNYYTSRFAPAISAGADANDLASLFHTMRKQRPRARAFLLSPMDPDSREYLLTRAGLKAAGLAVFPYFCFGNWYLPLTAGASSADQYLAARPGEVRSTLRRMSKRFGTDGGRIELILDEPGVERAIAAYTAVYAASWKVPEPHPDFMPGLIRLCARRGWLRLGIAWLKEQPIAAQLWIVNEGRACVYKLAYDSQFARYSPGSLLTASLIRQVIEVDRVHEVDYLTGDDAYKQDWMTHRRERWGLVAYDPSSPAGALLLTRELSASLSRPLITQVRSWAGKLIPHR